MQMEAYIRSKLNYLFIDLTVRNCNLGLSYLPHCHQSNKNSRDAPLYLKL